MKLPPAAPEPPDSSRRWRGVIGTLLAGFLVVLVFIGNGLANAAVEDFYSNVLRSYLLSPIRFPIPFLPEVYGWNEDMTRDHPRWAVSITCIGLLSAVVMRSLWVIDRHEVDANLDSLETEREDWLEERSKRHDREKALLSVVKLDGDFFTVLGSLAASTDREAALTAMATTLLDGWVDVFGQDLNRASIWQVKDYYLRPLANHQMPELSLLDDRFYVGHEGNSHGQPGVAGTAFMTRSTIIAKMEYVNGEWRCNQPSYTGSTHGRAHPSFRSFIAVPIQVTDDRAVGVLCMDSMMDTMWDSELTQQLAEMLAVRIGSSILVSEHEVTVSTAIQTDNPIQLQAELGVSVSSSGSTLPTRKEARHGQRPRRPNRTPPSGRPPRGTTPSGGTVSRRRDQSGGL